MYRKLFCILMAFIAVTLAGYYDSGMQTITQPNGIIFQARLFGDGDRTHFITDDSYEIIRDVDGYYYYAVLDSSENTFVPTQYKVGIDFPCSASYQLEYLEDTLYYSQGTYSPNGNYRIGIVLVEFSDRKHYEDNNGNGYLKSDFETMMFSGDGSWNTTETGATNPEGREVFGSLKEYYEFQTNGKVTIDTSSCVILTPTGNLWHELTGVFDSYDLQDIITELGLNGTYYDNYDKICIIHAGDVDYETRISPRGQIRGKFWIGPERNRYWCGVYGFTHIGIHAHEFGHTLGLYHTAGTEWNTIDENGDTVLTDLMALTSKYWDVMLNGNVNGPYKDAACPAGINPVYKIWHNWIDASDTVHISHDTLNLCIEYNYNSPKYYIVNRDHGIVGGEYYILENRQRSGWDRYTPIKPDYIAEPNDANANEGGLLIYKVQELYPNVMWGMNLNAGNVIGDQFKDTDWEQYQNAYCRAPFPLNQGQSINDYTIPNTNFYNIVNNYRYRDTCGVRNSNYAFHNIVWDSNTTTVTLDVITDFDNTWSGNITSDVEWSGNVKVVDDITINSGVTLTIAAGTTVEMSPDTRIYSDGGNLLINGTITDSVYVTPDVASTANREYYYGFLIKNADVDASYLKMDHSERGILTINSKTIVKNSVFEDGWFDGVYLKNCLSGSEISDCRFDNINYYGIYYSGGVNTNIYSNIFTGIGNSGLQLHTFNGSIGKNEFYDGNNDGIRFLSSSSGSMIRFYFTGYTDPFDIYNNKFLNNNSDAIYIDATSTPQVGANIQSGADTYYRGLNVLSKGSTGDYLVYSLNSATIDARCNYWDTYPIGLNYGSVNHNPPMQYFIPSNAFAKSINGLENDEEIIENKYDKFIAVGDSLQCIEKYKEAIIEYKKVLNLINDIPQSLIALNRIVSTYLIIEERDELKEYLIYLFEHTSSYLEGSVLTHLARCFDFGTFDRKSMLTLKEAILAFDDAENYEAAGMLILDYLEALGIEDEVKSSNLSKEMKHKEEMYFEELLLRKYSETEAANIYSEFSKEEQEVMLPEQIELLPVYPNPFNPKVNIPFKLSKTASIRIIIFDISGKKIWEKSARNFHAGAHIIQWNGYSTSSQPVSSGVYIVKLLVDNMMFTQKMILLK